MSHRTLTLNALLTLAALVGCGGDEDGTGGTPPPDTSWVNEKPIPLVATPGSLAVGDALTVLGQKFLDRANGTVTLRLKGTYFDTLGGTQAVDHQTKATQVSTGKLTWSLWPNIVFDKTGDHLGRFVGSVTVLNAGKDGTLMYSDPLPIVIDTKPSIIPRAVRPTSGGCSGVVKDTLEDQAVSLAVEVVGLREGTTDAPLTFYWTFLAEQWKVTFSYGTLDPKSVLPKTGAFMLEDSVTSGRVSTISDGGSKNFLLRVGSDLTGNTGLKELKTGTIPSGGNNTLITVNVAVVDASGKQAKLSIPLTIHHKADMHYDGASLLAERYAPVMVTDCIPGGDIGRDVQYQEGASESRARAMTFSFNAGAGGQLGLPSNPMALGINFSAGFGVNVNEEVRSDKSKSLSLSGHILPGEYGAYYRQTTKVHRVAKLVGYTACGQSFDLGQVTLTDWLFTPELATGPSCAPKSKLQPAYKFRD